MNHPAARQDGQGILASPLPRRHRSAEDGREGIKRRDYREIAKFTKIVLFYLCKFALICGQTIFLLVTQGIDRIQSGGFAGRIKSEKYPYGSRKCKGEK